MADAMLGVVFENLTSLARQEIGSIWGVGDEIKRLSSVLSTIHGVLEDAEERRFNDDGDRAVKNWLRKLADASHALEDVLDEFTMKPKKPCLDFGFSGALFRRRIVKKMNKAAESLDGIANERLKFHLREMVVAERDKSRARESGSVVERSRVFGREEDREKLVEFLVSGTGNSEGVSIYPVLGMGGIGKTTLAQLAFNDKRVVEHFELRVWVCVSEDFDAKAVMRAVVESSSGRACEDLDPLQRRLRERLRGKRFFIVLDDVWNEGQEQWDRLKHVLDCGSAGSSILVTTRLEKVAVLTGTTPPHRLPGLSEEDCWSLFKESAALGDEKKENSNFVGIGKEIAKKSRGVPLAARALGGLMRFKSEESEWVSVAENELWSVLRDESSVFPALRLSYLSLPVDQRRCFAFCSVFPKNFRVGRDRVIRLWMANGFVSSEEIGSRVFNDLRWRSLFKDYKKDYLGDWSFEVHDLVHDLARFVMEDKCHHMKFADEDVPTRAWYLSSEHCIRSASNSLRTLVLLSKENQSIDLDCRSIRFPSLRAFEAEHFTPTSFSSLASTSKHLRYLNLSYSNLQTLPESICELRELQTLDLTGCVRLKALPKNLSRLTSLFHLSIFGCVLLSRMPRHISRLTSLRTLSFYAADCDRGRRLEELEGLNLAGRIEIKGLEKIESPMDAKRANLAGKRNINKLSLCWNSKKEEDQDQGISDEVLENLEPPQSLTSLEIKNFDGVCFPHWLSNGTLLNAVSITLSNCKKCSNLPALNNLPLLKHLYIHQTDLVRFVEYEPRGGEPFGSLENLMIRNLPNLERLSRADQVEGREVFPCLSELYISHCYKLSTFPSMPSLKKLTVWKSHKGLLGSIHCLRGLTSLDVSKIDGVASFPDRALRSIAALKTLRVAYLPDLKDFLSDALAGLEALERLHVQHCDELECFPRGFFPVSNRLKHVTIEHCKKFASLSESFRNLETLQSLDLLGCPELADFPDGLENLSTLHHLTMSGPKMKLLPEALQYLPSLESMVVTDFPNLASLPEWLANIASLQELHIGNCPSLVSLPKSVREFADLKKLSIETCPRLPESCMRPRS